MRLIPTIPTVPHTSQSVHYWWRCDYNMDIYRIWKVCAQGDLERLLALSGTSYKWLSHRGVCPSSGPIIQFPKRRQVLFKIAGFHIGYNLFAPYLLFYCTDFSQIWYPRKAIFEENPAPYVTKDEDYSLWKTSAITEIAPLGSFWRYWWLSNPDFSYLDVPPSCPGRSPSVWHWFGWDLGYFGAEIWLSLVGFQGSGYFYCGMGL